MRDNDTRSTEQLIAWALSRPVLTKWLAVIAEDDPGDGLYCAVAGLLDPARSPLAVAFLKATGTADAAADALWESLPPGGLYSADWDAIRRAILDAHADACAWLCDRPHPR